MRKQLPAAHELPGFKGFYFSPRQRKVLVISLWETGEDLRQLEAHSALRERAEAEAGIKSPLSEIFEVTLQAP